MVGPLQKSSPRGHTFLLVAVDKFTKWIEATPVTSAATSCAVNFMRSIVCRFGVPHSIITDNGSNFASEEFQDFCEKHGIQLKYASVAHPQTNGQVEKANGLVTSGIKKRLMMPLKRAVGSWPEELPSVLWSLRTTPNKSTQYTPFFMIHGAEAVLPSNVCHNAPRVTAYVEADSVAALEDDVDALDEARDIALARSAVNQQNLRNYHNRRVCSRSFSEGDLVLRLKQKGHHKLESPWEGPYIIGKVIPSGVYRLKDQKMGVVYSNPWNVAQLHRFYA
jgi:transposase InsO family protein